MASVEFKIRAAVLNLKIYKIKKRMHVAAIRLKQNDYEDGVESFFYDGWYRAHTRYLYKLIDC